MEYIVLGTAGHIDHGKTSLVKTLTGTDTDRLKEEKERGITIDLGFAYMSLPSGTLLSIIDVPGHEKFIRNMVAGAAGIDMVLLVIAADDGVMPQTREHLEICSLLGIRHGLIAVTKADMVEDEWLKAIIEEVKGFIKGSFLEGTPVVPVSTVTGRGIKELVSNIDFLAKSIKQRKGGEILRLPVDRSFTIKGFGTVVTGTLVSGRVEVGDEVEILPDGVKARVRGLQIHGRTVEEGVAGSRVAINLQGVDRSTIRRGNTLTSPKKMTSTATVEAIISMLPSAPRPLKNGSEPMLHLYSSSSIAAVALLNSNEIRPGESAFARIKIKEPIAALHGDRFVLRTPDAGSVGGGIVLDVNPPRRSRIDALAELNILSSGELKEKILLYIQRSRKNIVNISDLADKFNTTPNALEKLISGLISSKEVVKIGEGLMSVEAIKILKEGLIEILGSFHKKEPIKAGLLIEEARTKLRIQQKGFENIVDGLTKDRKIVVEKDILRLATHKVFGGESKDRIERIYIEAGLMPPTLAELLERLKIKEREALDLLNLLFKEGRLVKVKDLFFSKVSVDELTAKVRLFFEKKVDMSPMDFKDMTGLSRKFAIPLLEYMDSQKITIRVGEARKLRKG